ncbi:hypothetical protein HWC80_gp038 [Mycobacterium phage Indlulamithi]|uniref:Uncharacterized protein n=1 Tax=Mycobacterium phage Indlulamithi TaxID=2656582 RepID=A0A649VD88_9CAUD|nr:hypothetical protein HWC80_gp038 [Mycobacterium phage Indlulamithi]QGJ90079.1 hypothetical protein PBI_INDLULAMITHI_38 [Mycobacterium phage Indlulamithi]
MNKQVEQQLSLFGLKPTAKMNREPVGQLSIEVLELSESPKQMMQENHRDRTG